MAGRQSEASTDQSSGVRPEEFRADEFRAREPDLADHWRLLKRHRWGIAGVTFLGLLIGVLSAFSVTPVYRAEATLLVEPAQPKLVAVSQIDGVPPIFLFYETQYEVLRSRSIAEAAAARLAPATRQALLEQAASAARGLREWLPEAWRASGDAPGAPDAMIARQIQDGLTARGGEKSQIIIVGYDAEQPAYAAEVANAVTQAYIEHGLEARLTTVRQASDWLSGRLADLKTKLEDSERLRQTFQSREELVDSENRARIISARLTNLASELVRAQAARSEAEIRFRQIREIREQGLGVEALVPTLKDALAARLAEEFARLEGRVAELAERYGPKHPKMIAAAADREDARQRLAEATDTAIDNIRKEYEAALAKEQETKRLIDEQQREMRELSGKAFQLAKLEQEVASNRQLYESFLARFKEIDVAGDSHMTNVQVIDAAKPPVEPFKPNRTAIIFLSFVLGLFAALVVTFVRERLDNTFRTAEDVEERLLLPVFALLPRLDRAAGRGAAPERWIVKEPHSAFSEAINNVRTGVMFCSIDAPIQTLLVTSALPGEGKTTLASNLAYSFSHLGRTLFIDADLRHPSVARIAGLKKGPGLSEWISGTNAFAECVAQDPESECLFIMASGAVPPNPLELISSRRFRDLFEKLKDEYAYIILDTPPVLPASDAIVLAHLVDGVILSVKADDTTHELAQDMLKRLHGASVRPLGAVLSLVDLRRQESYYGGRYYGGYYGEYYGARGKSA